MKTVTREPEAVNWNGEPTFAVTEVWTLSPEAVAKLEAATGFSYDSKLDTWANRNGESPTGVEQDLGWCAFYVGTVGYGDLLSADMRQGWLDAGGYEDFQSEMQREEADSRQYAWMS